MVFQISCEILSNKYEIFAWKLLFVCLLYLEICKVSVHYFDGSTTQHMLSETWIAGIVARFTSGHSKVSDIQIHLVLRYFCQLLIFSNQLVICFRSHLISFFVNCHNCLWYVFLQV